MRKKRKKKPVVVKAAAQMWPPLVFDFEGKAAVKECLRQQGSMCYFGTTSCTTSAKQAPNSSSGSRLMLRGRQIGTTISDGVEARPPTDDASLVIVEVR